MMNSTESELPTVRLDNMGTATIDMGTAGTKL